MKKTIAAAIILLIAAGFTVSRPLKRDVRMHNGRTYKHMSGLVDGKMTDWIDVGYFYDPDYGDKIEVGLDPSIVDHDSVAIVAFKVNDTNPWHRNVERGIGYCSMAAAGYSIYDFAGCTCFCSPCTMEYYAVYEDLSN